MGRLRRIGAQLGRGLALAASKLWGRVFSAYVQVTNRCNSRCPDCGFWRRPAAASEELTLDEWRRVARALAEIGPCFVSIEGGEPLLREDIAEIVAAFAERHLTALFTNGSLVTRPLAERLFAAGLGRASVSIDFAEPAEHDRRRGQGAWRRAWEAVDLLREAAPHGFGQVDVATIFMKANQAELDRLLRMSREHGVGHVFTLLCTRGDRRYPGGDELPEAAAVEAALPLWKRHPHLRVPRDYLGFASAFLRGEAMPRCRAGLQSLNIDHLGGVAPCIDRIDEPAGNVRRESLAAIWRRLIAADPGKDCQECWVLCRGYAQLLGKGGPLRASWDLLKRI